MEMPEFAEAVVVRPGMKLIIRLDPGVSAEQVHRFKDQLREQMPDVDVVVLACRQLAVYDPE